MIDITPTDTTSDLGEALGEEEVTTFKRKTVSGATSYIVRSLFLYSFSSVTNFIIGALLSVESYAIYGFVTQVIALLRLFSDVGLGPILVQKKREPTKQEYRTVFTVQMLLSLILFLIVVAISKNGYVFSQIGKDGVLVLLALGFSLPMATLKTNSAIILERKLDFSKLVIPSIAEQIVYNLLMIILLFSGYGVVAYAYAIFAQSVVGVATMWFIQAWPIGIAFKKSFVKSMFSMGTSFQASNILAAIKDQLFYLALWRFLPATSFGYVIWSKNWSQVPYTLTVQNVISITFPAYSRLQNDKARLKRAIEKTLFFITASIFPVLAGMSIFIYPLTQVIEKYHKWEPAVPTFILFTLSIGWAAISTPLTNTFNALGKVNLTLKLMILWTTLTWGLTFPAIKYFGFNGVSLAAFMIAFTSIIPVYFIRKIVKIDFVEHTWRQLAATLLMALIGVLGINVWSQSLLWMFVGIVVVGSTYVGAFLLVGWRKLLTEVTSLKAAVSR